VAAEYRYHKLFYKFVDIINKTITLIQRVSNSSHFLIVQLAKGKEDSIHNANHKENTICYQFCLIYNENIMAKFYMSYRSITVNVIDIVLNQCR